MDVEKTIEFILEQQAATAAEFQDLKTQIRELREIATAHERDLQVHTDWKVAISEALQDLATTTKGGFETVAAQHKELVQRQKTTEENLNILIQIVQDILTRLPKQ
jgi:hypothetical protein